MTNLPESQLDVKRSPKEPAFTAPSRIVSQKPRSRYRNDYADGVILCKDVRSFRGRVERYGLECHLSVAGLEHLETTLARFAVAAFNVQIPKVITVPPVELRAGALERLEDREKQGLNIRNITLYLPSAGKEPRRRSMGARILRAANLEQIAGPGSERRTV